MTTRANVYAENVFVSEIGSDAYPVKESDEYYGASLWGLMLKLDAAHATYKEFTDAILDFMDRDPEYVGNDFGGSSSGVANWSYEYLWVPFEEPETYRDWENWRGRVFIRKIDFHNTHERFGHSYFQIPGPWVHVKDWWIHEEMEEAIKGS